MTSGSMPPLNHRDMTWDGRQHGPQHQSRPSVVENGSYCEPGTCSDFMRRLLQFQRSAAWLTCHHVLGGTPGWQFQAHEYVWDTTERVASRGGLAWATLSTAGDLPRLGQFTVQVGVWHSFQCHLGCFCMCQYFSKHPCSTLVPMEAVDSYIYSLSLSLAHILNPRCTAVLDITRRLRLNLPEMRCVQILPRVCDLKRIHLLF
jgi:hypothetical protein